MRLMGVWGKDSPPDEFTASRHAKTRPLRQRFEKLKNEGFNERGTHISPYRNRKKRRGGAQGDARAPSAAGGSRVRPPSEKSPVVCARRQQEKMFAQAYLKMPTADSPSRALAIVDSRAE